MGSGFEDLDLREERLLPSSSLSFPFPFINLITCKHDDSFHREDSDEDNSDEDDSDEDDSDEDNSDEDDSDEDDSD